MHDILLIGDSLTEWNFENGWGSHLKDWYQTKGNVCNYGYAGWTSARIKMEMPLITGSHRFPMICTILLGTNDCYFEGAKVTPENFKQNIIHIIKHIRSLNIYAVILLITPPICKLDNKIKPYVIKAREIAAEQAVPLIDLHKSGPFQIVYSDLADGMHFNESGNKKLFEHIKSTILTNFKVISPDAL